MFRVEIPRDASETQVHVSSSGEDPIEEGLTFLRVQDLRDSPTALKLQDAIFSIEEGMTVFLWWDDGAGDTLILPLEGRGRLDLSPIGGIHNPRNEGWTGHVQLTTVHKTPGQKSFFLGLEFSKVKA